MLPTGETPDHIPRGTALVLVVLILVIIAAGALFYQSQERQIKDSVVTDLSTIALLKTEQIAAWRGERLGDAEVLSQNRILIDGINTYLASPDPASRQKILTLFEQINSSYDYRNVMLVDREGRVRLSLDPTDTTITPWLDTQLAESFATHTALLTDLSLGTGNQPPRMYAIAPFTETTSGSTEVTGAVILTIDPTEVLYPLIQSWPVPTDSAETVLVERAGDQVLFLNELRHRNNTALNLTIPLTQDDLPAVIAITGTTGAFEGTDYRGAKVISVLEPVRDSPWFMVAKIDTAEAYSAWRSRSVLITLLVAGILAGAFILLGLLWQRRQKSYYRTLYAAETVRRVEEQRNRERMETLLQLSAMESATPQELADFVLDAACRLTASPLAFIGMMSADESIFDITAWSKSVMEDCAVAASPLHFPIAKAGLWADAVRKRQPVLVNDYPAPLPGKKGLPEGHVPITRFVSVPIFEAERIVMVSAVANKESAYTNEDIDNLALLMQGVWAQIRKRKADDALLQKTTDLEAAFEEITATEEELRANYEELAKTQASLKESERKYRNLYQYAQVGLFETSFKNATVVTCNERYATLAGYSSVEEAIGSDVLHLYANPEDRTEVSRILKKEGHIENYVLELRNHATGEIFWTQFSARFNYEREVAEGSIIDITAQKTAEAALLASEDAFRSIAENANDGFLVGAADGRHVFANKRAADITGYSIDELVHTSIRDLVRPDEFEQVIKDRFRKRMAGEPAPTQYETILIGKDGHEIPIELSSSKITWYGEPADLIVFRDITDRRRILDTLRESEEKFRALFTRMIEGSAIHEMIYDPGNVPADYRILDVNPAYERIIGLRREEVIGKTSREAYGIDTPPFLETYARVASTGHPEVFEVFFAPMEKHFSISVSSPQQGKFATIFEDITERKQDEQQREMMIRELEQKNAELERFTYTISHDLKSPLITIKGFAGLLESDAQRGNPEQLKQDILRISRAADTMQALLNDVLELSRVGRVINPPSRTPFGTIAKEAVELLEGPLAEHGVTVEIAPDLPVVNVDRARIREVLVNLIENSVKFLGDEPRPRIRIGAETDGGMPVFFVQDNGIGIDPRYLERIFNLFEKLNPSMPGTGIGLPIVRRIIEVHGGKIWAESEGIGKGTIFRFTLPGERVHDTGTEAAK